MSLPLRDSNRHTYGEYITWSEEQRYELIDGIAYAMSPAPNRTHQRMVAELLRQIADALENSRCEVNVAPFDVRLPIEDEADDAITTVVQPDLTVVCDSGQLDERGCRGAPDWVIEVLSPTTAGHDQIKKLAVYERHGVKEYWLVHPVDRIVTIYRLEGSGYGRPQVMELQGTLGCEVCTDVIIDWARVLQNLPEEPV